MSKVAFLDEMIADMQAGTYDFTVDGKCSNCGNCCSDFLPISQREINKIKDYIKKHKIKEQKKMIPAAVPVIDLTCPFRSESQKKCMIYEVRPLICMDFQCNNPRQGIKACDEMYNEPRPCVSMRKTFFPKKKHP